METDLLLKESEFYKENEKLELETKQLLQKVNDVMKIQDNLIKDTFQVKVEISNVRKNNYKYTKPPSENEQFFEQGCDTSNQSNFNEGLCKVYKTKLKGIIAEKERLSMELRQKGEEIKKLQKDNQQLKTEKEKWFLSYNAGKTNIGKLETQVSNMTAKLQSRDNENLSLKKEVEQLRKDLKNATSSYNNCDVRLNRTCEEVEKLKITVKTLKDEDKEIKESYKKKVAQLNSIIKQLEKQKFEILTGFKKQMELIEVLRKQKLCIEEYKIKELAEAELQKIMERMIQ